MPLGLISDNGGDYVSNEFLHICSQSGIQVQNSIPYTLQQNRVAERKNRSLKEMTTCMLESKKLTTNLQAEAIHYAAYIYEKLIHSSVKGKNPFKSYFGHKLDVSNLRVFGSTAWARIPLDKRRDLQPQSIDVCLLGILMNQKVSSCWISKQNRSLSKGVSSSMSLFRRQNQ